MTYAEAKAYLDENNISLGAVVLDGKITDTATAYVFKQRPETRDAEGVPQFIRPGQVMDLWLSQAMKIVTDSAVDKKNQLP